MTATVPCPAVKDHLRQLVEANDPDALLRAVDGLVSSRDWETLHHLQMLCREAVERGKQLWSVADHIDYRLALEAPPEWAGPVVTESASRFLLGPLPEVAAMAHTWEEMEPYIPAGPARAVFAHERVVRGEDLRNAPGVDPAAAEVPLVLETWEPDYPVAEYRSGRADFPTPAIPALEVVELPGPARRIEDRPGVEALGALTAAWTESSNGRIDVVAVQGDAAGAIAALGLRRAGLTELTLPEAMATMAWTAASGGAYGRRRGAAAGRFAAWWTVAALTDLLEDWPLSGLDLSEAGRELKWYAFSDLFPTTGWSFHMAVEDPMHGLAWAISAGDAA